MSADNDILLTISSDHMRLHVRTLTPDGVSLSRLYEKLVEAGIQLTAEVEDSIKPHLAPSGMFVAMDEIVLLNGTLPLDDVPASLQMEVDIPDSFDGGQNSSNDLDRIDFYSQNNFVSVKEGQTIATIIPYSRGANGVDIFGKTVVRKIVSADRVRVGKNAAISEDGKKMIATITGCVHTDHLKVWVEPQLAIPRDIDFSTGHISFEGDVAIGRNVLDLFKVKVTGNLTIGGVVEGADVEAGGDLTVQGGIAQKEKGRCKAGGTLRAKYVTNASLEAGGDVIVRKELANSRVVAGGKVIVENGPLMGGTTVALTGVLCHSLGSASCVRTLVELGVDESLRKFPTDVAPKIESVWKRVLTIRNDIAPMLNNQKNLTAQQKERITELMFEASEAENKLKEDLALWREKLNNVKSRLSGDIVIQNQLYAGVVLRFGEMETAISEAVKGPMKITLRVVDRERQLVAVNTLSGSVHVLETRYFHDEQLEQARKLLEEKFKL